MIGKSKAAILLAMTLLALTGFVFGLSRTGPLRDKQFDVAENDAAFRSDIDVLQACPSPSNNPNCPTPAAPTIAPPTPAPPTPFLATPVVPDTSSGNPDNPNKRATQTAEIAYQLTRYQLSLTPTISSGNTFTSSVTAGGEIEVIATFTIDSESASPESSLDPPAKDPINLTFIAVTLIILLFISIILVRLRR